MVQWMLRSLYNNIWSFLKRKKFLSIFVAAVILIGMATLSSDYRSVLLFNVENFSAYNEDNSEYISKFDGNFSISKDKVPRILFWTGFFGKPESWVMFYDLPLGCAHHCEYSWEQGDVERSDVIVMNLRDLSDYNNTLPPSRNMSQVWMLHNTEPPQLSFLDLRNYDGIFNWTSFIRLDSDFPSFYGKLVKKSGPVLESSQTSDVTEAAVMDSSPKRSKMVAWMASNCITDSGREWYVRELRRHIVVDIYGHCGSLNCIRTAPQVCRDTLRQYYFYLAFENAKCRDYVTEKFWRALRLGLIPVVMSGEGAHRKIAPQGSYIDSQDFSSPKDLADYLKKVVSNRTLYGSYFEWKSQWEIGGNYLCDLCSTVYMWKGTPQVYHDLVGWFRQDTCPPYNIWQEIHHKLKFVPYFGLYLLGLW